MVAKPGDFLRLTRQKQRFIEELREYLSCRGFSIEVSVGISSPRHLAKLKPRIFTVELKKFGKVLWGDENILNLVPNYPFSRIDLLDGFILLNNRIIEQLKVLDLIKENKDIPAYVNNKAYWQMANVLLTLFGEYRALYSQKQEQVAGLFQQNPQLREIFPDFPAKLNQAVLSARLPAKKGTDALENWQIIRLDYKKLWFYYLQKLISKSDCRYKDCLRQADYSSRVKGWLKFIAQNNFSFIAIKQALFYANTTSPQFYVYARAAQVYFDDLDNAVVRCEIIDQ